jgi:mono/diheme cytochrome c family protein
MRRNLLRVGGPIFLLSAAMWLGPLSWPGEAQNPGDHATTPDPSRYAELGKVPEKARSRKNPLESDPEAVLVGRKLFARNCAECHGSAAEGGKKAPSLRAAEVQNATPGTIFWILSNGVVRRGMPVWSKLPEPQRWAIVAYIKTLQATPAGTQ